MCVCVDVYVCVCVCVLLWTHECKTYELMNVWAKARKHHTEVGMPRWISASEEGCVLQLGVQAHVSQQPLSCSQPKRTNDADCASSSLAHAFCPAYNCISCYTLQLPP